MPKPPISPLIKDGKNITYFQYLAEEVRPLFDMQGVNLDFTGYEETVRDYRNLKYDDFDSAWRLANEANAWSEYMSDLLSVSKRILRDLESDKLSIIATASVEADESKVANGDRLANKNDNVIAVRRSRNLMQSFCDQLNGKIEFLERAHYFCKSTFDWYQKTASNRN